MVRAVVASIGAAYAGSVGKLANAAEFFVGIEVSEIEGGDGKRIKRFYFAVGVVDAATLVFPGKSGDVIERSFERDRLGECDNGDFTLSANDHVHEALVESLVRQQGRVRSAEDNREPWRVVFDSGSRLNGAADHGPGED